MGTNALRTAASFNRDEDAAYGDGVLHVEDLLAVSESEYEVHDQRQRIDLSPLSKAPSYPVMVQELVNQFPRMTVATYATKSKRHHGLDYAVVKHADEAQLIVITGGQSYAVHEGNIYLHMIYYFSGKWDVFFN